MAAYRDFFDLATAKLRIIHIFRANALVKPRLSQKIYRCGIIVTERPK